MLAPQVPSAYAHQRIAGLFPFHVSVSAMTVNCAEPPYPTTAQRRAARRREFMGGRLCAKRALAGLGAVAASVGKQASGAPHWPEGFVGSISHTRDLCAAVVAQHYAGRSLGLDIECNGAAVSTLAALILAPSEAAPTSLFGAGNWLTAIFSAKEAFYKCDFPAHRQFLHFHDWRTAFQQRGERFGTFTIAPVCSDHTPRSGIGFWSLDEAHIYTGFSTSSTAD